MSPQRILAARFRAIWTRTVWIAACPASSTGLLMNDHVDTDAAPTGTPTAHDCEPVIPYRLRRVRRVVHRPLTK